MNVINIVTGFWNKALSRNSELRDWRIQNACIKCPLYVNDWCDSSKEGCGCMVSAKTTVQNEKCPQGVWANDWIKPERLEQLINEHKKTLPL